MKLRKPLLILAVGSFLFASHDLSIRCSELQFQENHVRRTVTEETEDKELLEVFDSAIDQCDQLIEKTLPIEGLNQDVEYVSAIVDPSVLEKREDSIDETLTQIMETEPSLADSLEQGRSEDKNIGDLNTFVKSEFHPEEGEIQYTEDFYL